MAIFVVLMSKVPFGKNYFHLLVYQVFPKTPMLESPLILVLTDLIRKSTERIYLI
jgi:hypothetical protein